MDTYEQKYHKYKSKYLKLKSQLKVQSGGGNSQNIPTLTLIKAEWCGHCQRFKPEWEELQKTYNEVQYKTIDSENKEQLSKYEFKGFPSIFLEINDNPKSYIEYNGTRTKEQIIKFIEENKN